MVNSVGTSNINSIQMFSALNAFKTAQAKPIEQSILDVSDGIDINEDSLLRNKDVSEIKKFAEMAGESNISEEDIKYGITYGRSVIADYIA